MNDPYVTQGMLRREFAQFKAEFKAEFKSEFKSEFKTELKAELKVDMDQFVAEQEVRLKQYVDDVAQLIFKAVDTSFQETNAEIKWHKKEIELLKKIVGKQEKVFSFLDKIINANSN